MGHNTIQISRQTIVVSNLMQENVTGTEMWRMQLNGGLFQGEILRIELPGLSINFGNYNLAIKTEGAVADNRYLFALVLGSRSTAMFCKQNFDSVYWPPRTEIDVFLGDHSGWCTLSFEKDCFESAFKQIKGTEDLSLLDQSRVGTVNQVDEKELLKTVRDILLSRDHLLLMLGHDKVKETMSEDLMELCIRTFFGGHCNNKAQNFPRRKVVDQAERFLQGTNFEPIQISKLAETLQVSVRTLEYAFRDTYDISPKRYMNIRRLNWVRHKLFNDPKRTVTEHAMNAGFWHLAHFAASYKALFGELPSETLKKVRVAQRVC